MNFSYLKTGLVIAAFAALYGCSEPPVPSEVQLATSQEQDLWRAGASVYAPDQYQLYINSMTFGRELLIREQARLSFLRDYKLVEASFRDTLAQGERLKTQVNAARKTEATVLATDLVRVRKKIQALRELTETLKDKRLAMRKLVQAEISLEEAGKLAATGKPKPARQKLTSADQDATAVIKVIRPVVKRYADRGEIARWRKMVDTAIATSRRAESDLIVVDKLDRQLTLYRNGTVLKSYDAGLGFNYLADKLYSGDRATPEGVYRVIRKLDRSKFFKALLIDYPNDEDRRRFAQAKRAGLVPRNAGIGNLIEIHGGGKDCVTYGCVALDDQEMAELYAQIAVDTPVVIVGTTNYDNFISSALRGLN